MTLCELCSSIDLHAVSNRHHHNLASLRDSSRTCELCLLFYRAINEDIARWLRNGSTEASCEPVYVRGKSIGGSRRVNGLTDLVVSDFEDRSLQHEYNFEQSGPRHAFQIVADEGTPAAAEIVGRTLALNSSSDSTFRFISGCIDNCLQSHPACIAPDLHTSLVERLDGQVLPTRVIDVGSTESGYKIHLLESKGLRGRYVALSHCWGSSRQFTTTIDTLRTRAKEILYDELPKTFQDAVVATRKLQLRYLWIDSLCIIQDSAEDWQRESSMMGRIYSNSFVTIAASAPPDDRSVGCFVPRPLEALDYIRVPYWSRDNRSKGYFYVHSRPTPYHRIQEASPLQKRSWALQERLLSSRTISFTQSQVYFECAVSVVAEDRGPLRVVDIGGLAKRSLFPMATSEASESGTELPQAGWYHILEEYSKRSLTIETDIFPAISGLVRYMQTLGRSEYAAGVWKDHICHDLAWHSSSTKSKRVEKFRAPSWSWASLIGGGISFSETYTNDTVAVVADNAEITTRVSSIDPNGAVESGIVALASWVVRLTREVTNPKLDDLNKRRRHKNPEYWLEPRQRVRNMIVTHPRGNMENGWTSADGLSQGRVVFDDVNEKPETMYAVPLKQGILHWYDGKDQLGHWVFIALFLVPTGKEGEFRRVGAGDLIQSKDVDNGRKQQIVIV